MKTTKSLTVLQEKTKDIKEQMRFYLSTPERCAEALLFIRNIEEIVEEAKTKIKDRAGEFMDMNNKEFISYTIVDQVTGEIREWEVRRMEPTVSLDYDPRSVISALGEDAIPFFKVNKTKLDNYLKHKTAKKELAMTVFNVIRRNATERMRKGSIQLRELKSRL